MTILLYGCESWVISHDMESKINAFATFCYRIMLNIKRKDHVPNTMIYSMTNTEPLIHHVRNRHLRFLGHILRLPEEEPVSWYAFYIPPHGNRIPGRPRTFFFSLHTTVVGVRRRQYTIRPDSHACQRSKCTEKSPAPQPKDDDNDDDVLNWVFTCPLFKVWVLQMTM